MYSAWHRRLNGSPKDVIGFRLGWECDRARDPRHGFEALRMCHSAESHRRVSWRFTLCRMGLASCAISDPRWETLRLLGNRQSIRHACGVHRRDVVELKWSSLDECKCFPECGNVVKTVKTQPNQHDACIVWRPFMRAIEQVLRRLLFFAWSF